MKYIEMRLTILVFVGLLISACTGSTQNAAPEPTPEEAATAVPTEAPVQTPDEEPAATPASEVTDDELIAAAIAQLDRDIAADNGPEGTIAYDLINSKAAADGSVTLTICAWDGQTAFDTVRDSIHRTTIADDGTITAQHISTPLTTGDCLNTHLIETALDFVNNFDHYWTAVSADPVRFQADQQAFSLMTETYWTRTDERVQKMVEDGLSFVTSYTDGDVRATAQAAPLFRRYSLGDEVVLELVTCRNMNPAHGSYKDGVLFDDGSPEDGSGEHSIDAYQLTADPASELGWRITGDAGLLWADCFNTNDWPGAANAWRPRDVELVALP